MAAHVIMPMLGMAQETGKVLRWLKPQGQAITKGEPLVEIETDKVTVELEAPASGILAQVMTSAGESVPVGHIIAVIAAPGEVLTDLPPSGVSPVPLSQRPAASASTGTALTPSGTPARPQASPKARRLASERGIDLATVSGSGPSGVVVANDLPGAVGGGAAVEPVPLATSAAWRVMAQRTTQSWTSVPHFFLFREVNATALIAARDRYRAGGDPEVTYTDLLINLVATALRAHPRLNGRWANGQVVLNAEIHVGIAVAVEEGLIVPVIRHADRLPVAELVVRRRDLVARAQHGTLRLEDVQGGTFTISNLGMYGVDAFTAVLNPPQAALLAVGQIADRVVPVEGRPSVQPMMVLSLACDHRVADGARGAQFLQTLAALIAQPPAEGTG